MQSSRRINTEKGEQHFNSALYWRLPNQVTMRSHDANSLYQLLQLPKTGLVLDGIKTVPKRLP